MAQQGFNLQSIPGQLATPESWENAYSRGTIRSKAPSSGACCDICRMDPIPSHVPRHRCLHCEDFDSCGNCLPSTLRSHFLGHQFIKVEPSMFQESSVHAGVQCDACHYIIKGIRYKCHQCPDYDLCQGCIAHGFGQAHNHTHTFAEIHTPHRAQTAPASINWEPQQPQQAPGWRTIPATATAPEMIVIPKKDVPPAMKRLTSCTFCKQSIMRDRYKCTECPDVDACDACFQLHPHTFLRMSATATDICISFSNAPVLPVHGAYCDGCRRTIVGVRYKCAQCPNFDLCETCEKAGVYHPPNHAFIQIKTPAQTPPISPPIHIGHASTLPPQPMYPYQNPYAAFRPAFQAPALPTYAQPAVDPAKKKHDQKVAITDNLKIVNILMSIGMTLFGNN